MPQPPPGRARRRRGGAVFSGWWFSSHHRGLSAAALAGNEAAAAKRQAVQQEVDQALAAADTALQALQDPVLSQRSAALLEQWQPLAQAVAGKTIEAPASFSRHGTLVSAQLDLLRDMAQATGMALDAHPATHHAINATLNDLPRLTEALGQLRARGATALQKQAATPEDKARIEALAAMARLFDRNARHAFEQVGRADARMAGALATAREQAHAQADEALALVQKAVLASEALDHPSAAYFERQTKAIDAQFALVDAAFAEVRQALDDRAGGGSPPRRRRGGGRGGRGWR